MGLERHADEARGLRTAFFNNHNFVSTGKYVLGSHDRIERQQVLRALIMAGPDGFLH